jgi:hypothetical protein
MFFPQNSLAGSEITNKKELRYLMLESTFEYRAPGIRSSRDAPQRMELGCLGVYAN